MIGFRFYEEFNDTRKKHPTGSVYAVRVDNNEHHDYLTNETMIDVITTVFGGLENSSVSKKWLRSYTKRISEEKARKIHPNLFRYLDV